MSFFSKHKYLILIVLSAFLLRIPAYFNDYYDVDELSAIVQTKQYYSGLTPGIDFKESKHPLYHTLFKVSYGINQDYGWLILHILVSLIVALTGAVIYRITKEITYKSKTAFAAGILYTVLICSFNRYFIATNGEIVYNLPVSIGALSIVLFLKTDKLFNKIMYLLLLASSSAISAGIKFHGLIISIIAILFFVFILPFREGKINRKYAITMFSFLSAIIAIFAADYFIFEMFSHKVINDISSKLRYATLVYGLEPLSLIIKFLHRQGLLTIWHPLIWISFFAFTISFFKNRVFFKTEKTRLFIIISAFITYLMVFAGGKRLYFHYFMTSYPFVCIVSSIYIEETRNKISFFFKKHFRKMLLIPAFFFFLFNVKDVIIKHTAPELFIFESKASYYFRLIALGTTNDYLMPDKLYFNLIEYIKTKTKKEDKIFVWGDGAYIYYFSDRLPAAYHMWPKGTIVEITSAYQSQNTAKINRVAKSEKAIIYYIEKYNAELFIDTSDAAKSTMGSISPFTYKITPLVDKYIKSHYIFEKEIDKFKIYRKRNQ
jgi:hypothetical protein